MFWTFFFAILTLITGLHLKKKHEGFVIAAFVRGDDIGYRGSRNNRIYELLRPIMPGRASLDWISERIIQARLKNTPEQIWVLSYVMFALFAALALFFGLNFFKDKSITLIFCIVGGIIGAALPLIYVYQETQKADQSRTKEMLPLIQLLKVLAKSGVGTSFSALAAISLEDTRGHLAADIRDALEEISKGKGRHEAVAYMVKRSRSKLLKEVMDQILDSEDKEIPLYKTLEVMESRLLKDIELKADAHQSKLEDKLAIPLAAMLVPASMIIIMAPGLINARSLLHF